MPEKHLMSLNLFCTSNNNKNTNKNEEFNFCSFKCVAVVSVALRRFDWYFLFFFCISLNAHTQVKTTKLHNLMHRLSFDVNVSLHFGFVFKLVLLFLLHHLLFCCSKINREGKK